MRTDLPYYHLAIIGGGLSGSLLTIDLLEHQAGKHPLQIFNCDRDNAFGAGVPYGEHHAQPGFLLIESVAQSTPREFQEWIGRHAERLARAAADSDDSALRTWASDNLESIVNARFGDLFVPRRWFGQFMRERHAAAIARAAADGTAEVECSHAECMDVEPVGGNFVLSFADGRRIRASLVVLAMGNIPRPAHASPGLAEGYLHDIWQQRYEGLARMLHDRFSALKRALDVKLIGSAATACEVVYFLAHQPHLLERIRTIEVVSRSGYLAGGGAQLGAPAREIRADAAAEPAAREYVNASRRLAVAGILTCSAVNVSGPPHLLADGRLAITPKAQPQVVIREADVIVNCSGPGNIDSTSSPLLRNMLGRGRAFRPNRVNVGFELRDRFETAHVPGCFVIGPLLNEESVETHVESIHGVYRAVESLAPVVHSRVMPLLFAGVAHGA